MPLAPNITSLDDFWVFLHHLLELTAAYRFLLRDMETLMVEYPKVRNALKHFARAVNASFELYLHAMADSGIVALGNDDVKLVSRNLAVIALFAEKYDALVGSRLAADDAALRSAASILNVLKPYVAEAFRHQLVELVAYYEA